MHAIEATGIKLKRHRTNAIMMVANIEAPTWITPE